MAERVTHMMLALRNKQIFVLFALIVLSLLVLTVVVLSLAHINIWQAAGMQPNAFIPWS
jgi:hypothetical protein